MPISIGLIVKINCYPQVIVDDFHCNPDTWKVLVYRKTGELVRRVYHSSKEYHPSIILLKILYY